MTRAIQVHEYDGPDAFCCSGSTSRPARCGETLEIIASIEEPQVVATILSHLQRTVQQPDPAGLPRGARAPPAPSHLV